MKPHHVDLFKEVKAKVATLQLMYHYLVVEPTENHIDHAMSCAYYVVTQCHSDLKRIMGEFAKEYGYEETPRELFQKISEEE